jgi:uncharacterized membrane protein YcaP (DUF421 family)
MFFDDWSDLLRIFVVGTLAYAALVMMLRVSGKRTLSKLNAFDLIVTIALGSTLATVLLSRDVALLEGLFAFVLLIGLQWVVAWLSVRSEAIRGLVKSEPRLLMLRGEMLPTAMRDERISADEIRAAVRSQGIASLRKVEAVVLETDGTISVLGPGAEAKEHSALRGVRGFAEERDGLSNSNQTQG